MAATIGLKGGSGTTASIQINGSDKVTLDTSGILTVTGEVRATSNITAYYSSDSRLKENIQPIENALDKVVAIGGQEFDWTTEYLATRGGEDGYFIQKHDFGVIAQEVQKVFPVAVRQRSDGYLAVDYEKLCALAFQAIKELNEKVNTLEQKINNME